MFLVHNPTLSTILMFLASCISVHQIVLVHKKKEKYTLFPFYVMLSYLTMAGTPEEVNDVVKGFTAILGLVYMVDMFLVQPYKAAVKKREKFSDK